MFKLIKKISSTTVRSIDGTFNIAEENSDEIRRTISNGVAVVSNTTEIAKNVSVLSNIVIKQECKALLIEDYKFSDEEATALFA